ncbi:MAG: NmrA/HSCARG family protein [Alphaproteobacteria bacterium]
MTRRTVLVTGATGKQGGAVARALLAAGHDVVALTRNPKHPSAAVLVAAGARLTQGDFRHAESLLPALREVDTLYLMGTPYGSSVEEEVTQGIAAVDAARQARIGHLIYGSVAGADTATGIPHFDSKSRIERHIAGTGIDATISAPAAFMDFLNPALVDGLRQGELRMALSATRPLQYVSVTDIGRFVASLVERRQGVFGRRIEIAGDELTGPQTAATLSLASGRDIRYAPFPAAALRAYDEDLAAMFEWFERDGYSVDRAVLAREFPEIPWQSVADWAREQDWVAALSAHDQPQPAASGR